MGLAQSGKTTIVKVTAEGMIPQKKADYTATLDYKRNTYDLFGTKVSMFDLGGQKSFLDRFIGELAEFVFSSVSVLIFVVDVSNMDTISLAKYYYEMGKKTLKKYSPEAETKILLHKMDLIDAKKKDDFIISVKEFLEFDKADEIFETNVFDHTIFIAMERIIRGLNKEQESLDIFLKNFQKEYQHQLEYLLIKDKEGMELGKLGMTTINSKLYSASIETDYMKEIQQNDPLMFSVNQFNNKLIFYSLLKSQARLLLIFSSAHLGIIDEEFVKLLHGAINFKNDVNKVL